MRTDLFDYQLPPDRIALRPVSPRDAARLLIVRPGTGPEFEDRTLRDLPEFLRPGDALVLNDTKVIPARLEGVRTRDDGSAKIEATLIERRGEDSWLALVKPAKRLQPGDRIRFGHEGRVCLLGNLDAMVEEKGEGGEVLLRFDFHGPVLEEAIETLGHVPLPPYIAARRADDEQDRTDYQTVYAAQPGSVAAPTAGLHFTPELLEAYRGARRCPRTRDAACRRRHVSSGEERGHHGPSHAPGARRDLQGHGRHLEQCARARRPHRRRRHHGVAAA